MQRVVSLLMLCLVTTAAHAAEGLVTVRSAHSVDGTMQRLVAALEEKGMRIFARVNHTEGARRVGQKLPPTQLLIFGNPKSGTPLMQCSPSAAIDLPQKALVWEDDDGQVWLGYNAPAYLSRRHRMSGCDKALEKVAKALANFASKATAPERAAGTR
ncbi:MAG: DUF302 domain-containing protein [Gammaproteobacteria bacterium]|nr:DUF302 domain-containing protein [Gammaproteobacteria bacterium]